MFTFVHHIPAHPPKIRLYQMLSILAIDLQNKLIVGTIEQETT